MNTTALSRTDYNLTPKPHFLDGLAARAVRARLSGIKHGEITLVDGTRHERYGQRTAFCPLSVTVHIHDQRFWGEIAFAGTIGAGEGYMQDYWSSNDLTALVRILLCNRPVLDGMETGLAWITTPLQQALHWLNRNTRKGSRRNIAAHYDLGNDFFKLFLDSTLMYSSAIFAHPKMTLEQAQLERLDRICRKLDLKSRDHLLEIGTGWGGMAIYAAQHYGCRVTTTTLSREQQTLAIERIRQAGLQDRITVLLNDYRDLQGQYDKLVSIEMIEAVGHDFYDTYFKQCSNLLKPDGLMLLQAITIGLEQVAT
ncbi:MAG: cyclopropane-fatty-acyl-phospholipid synthase family protein, partial [Gammaproteobacteria bacterium]|nr:cyclopropane-fatty-acyl-phospholipid synthase family protein [Gammaproteobacteria bacterium]